MRVIEIVVAPTGETRLETKGFAGAGCQQASRFLEASLGKRTGESLTVECHEHLGQLQQSQERS